MGGERRRHRHAKVGCEIAVARFWLIEARGAQGIGGGRWRVRQESPEDCHDARLAKAGRSQRWTALFLTKPVKNSEPRNRLLRRVGAHGTAPSVDGLSGSVNQG
jgi:hypothetical protein